MSIVGRDVGRELDRTKVNMMDMMFGREHAGGSALPNVLAQHSLILCYFRVFRDIS